MTFETSMKQLEKIVYQLEKGEAGLDESMKLFEQGTGLVRQCSEMIAQAEQKVTLLLGGDEPEEIPFQEGESSDEL